MALYDDRRILLKQLRHAFITGDETQMCEHVLLNDDFPLPCDAYDSGDEGLPKDKETSGRAESPDIFFGSGPHRPRTYTAVRLEKIKRERESAAKVKHVFWCQREGEPTEAELDEMFAKKVVVPKPVKKVSKLTKMIENSPPVPPNPFSMYARFNALPNSHGVKEMKIFVNSLEEKRRVPPIKLVVVNTARVSEAIGLILWHYVNQNRTPLLHDSVECFNLMYAEEDGEIDYEFPSLDKKEIIGRFHFSSLALVALPPKVEETEETVRVIVMPSQDVIDVVLPLETAHEITVSKLLTLAAEQCTKETTANRLRSKIFIVRDKGDPNNTILSLGSKILECSNLREFVISPAETRSEEIRMRKHLALMEASLYQSFMVNLVQKIGSAEIHLGISAEKIEVNPVGKSPGILPTLLQVKPATYHIDTIADCMMVEESKYGKRSVVRLVRKTPTGTYKNLDFECDHVTAVAIDQKCKGILHFRGSMTRQEYLEYDNARKNAKKK